MGILGIEKEDVRVLLVKGLDSSGNSSWLES